MGTYFHRGTHSSGWYTKQAMASSFKKDTCTTDSDETDEYQELSCKLYRALDAVGVSEEVRKGYRLRCTVEEILSTAVYKVTRNYAISKYIFGSQYEGTTTRGLCSDEDVLLCDERFLVVEQIDGDPLSDIVLLILTEDSKPGYVKLQFVFNKTKEASNKNDGYKSIAIDEQGRVLLKHNAIQMPDTKSNGPAYTFTYPPFGRTSGVDMVYAVRCRTIPRVADEWLRRSRPHQWPSQEQLQRMGSYGCFFVGVAHPESRNKETEWRISFSLQERELMRSLNPTQHKCYVLLKMIKKDIIKPRVGKLLSSYHGKSLSSYNCKSSLSNHGKSLSSYHCKTCIFHLAESLAAKLWTPHNLVPRLLECLTFLLDCVTHGNCPNYFIKEENMFDKLDKLTLKNLSCVLQEILSKRVCFIYEIKCDDLASKIHESEMYLESTRLQVTRYYEEKFWEDIEENLDIKKKGLEDFVRIATTSSESLSRADHTLQYLEQTKVTIEHEPTEVQATLDSLIAYIHQLVAEMKLKQIKEGRTMTKHKL